MGRKEFAKTVISVVEGWTQGFFPGSIWLVAERERLLPGSLERARGSTNTSGYTLAEVESAARRWQGCFRHQTRPAINHDQGFRFQPCYGRCVLDQFGRQSRLTMKAITSFTGPRTRVPP